jgi:hypothetical protein
MLVVPIKVAKPIVEIIAQPIKLARVLTISMHYLL